MFQQRSRRPHRQVGSLGVFIVCTHSDYTCSLLVGSAQLVTKAKTFRKLFGGGIRQSGSLAAVARFCLDTVFPTMPRTHQLTRTLALGLHKLGVRILMPVETNMLASSITPAV